MKQFLARGYLVCLCLFLGVSYVCGLFQVLHSVDIPTYNSVFYESHVIGNFGFYHVDLGASVALFDKAVTTSCTDSFNLQCSEDYIPCDFYNAGRVCDLIIITFSCLAILFNFCKWDKLQVCSLIVVLLSLGVVLVCSIAVSEKLKDNIKTELDAIDFLSASIENGDTLAEWISKCVAHDEMPKLQGYKTKLGSGAYWYVSPTSLVILASSILFTLSTVCCSGVLLCCRKKEKKDSIVYYESLN